VKGKLKFVLPLVALVLLGGAYKTVLAEPVTEPEPKVKGQVYVLPKEFLLNLHGGRYAKLSVALVLPKDEVIADPKDKKAAAPPDGFGPLPQEAVVRGLVTDTLTGVKAERLIDPKGRAALKRKLHKRLKSSTDVNVKDVLFTDVAVQ
jgi:flagellar basal body-associated protein FliL